MPELPPLIALPTSVQYADGAEDGVLRVLRAARDRSSTSDELASHIVDWPTSYHFSRLRQNILRPLRIEPGMRVLDVGGGTGPIARRVAELGAYVDVVEGSPARAECAAARCAGLDGVRIFVGSAFDLPVEERYDLILLIGVLEYIGTSPAEAGTCFRKLDALLDERGVLAIAIENQIGLKYLLTYAEDHIDIPWVGVEGYPGRPDVRTYSRRELASLLESSGFSSQSFLYPFPDYKMPRLILSEDAYASLDVGEIDALVRQPCTAEATKPLLYCDAREAHRTMLRAGLGPDVANSFLVVAGRDPGAVDAAVDKSVLAWLSGTERRSVFMRDRRLVISDGALVIRDDGPVEVRPETTYGWLRHQRAPELRFERGKLLDVAVVAALAGPDISPAADLLRLWAEYLHAHVQTVPADSPADDRPPSPFLIDDSRPRLPGTFLDVALDNFLLSDGGLRQVDQEWDGVDGVDLGLVAVRALFYVAVEILARGMPHPFPPAIQARVLATELSRLAGLEDDDVAWAQLPAAEAALQTIVLGRSEGDLANEIRAMCTATAGSLQEVHGSLPLTALRRNLDRAALRQAVLDDRNAHLEQTVAVLRADLERLAVRQAEVSELEHTVATSRAEVGALEAASGDAAAEARNATAEAREAERERDEAIDQLAAVLASESYKLGRLAVAPLAFVARGVRGLRRHATVTANTPGSERRARRPLRLVRAGVTVLVTQGPRALFSRMRARRVMQRGSSSVWVAEYPMPVGPEPAPSDVKLRVLLPHDPVAAPTLSIVIPIWNALEVARPCLESVYQVASEASFEVIVVDNGSEAPVASMLEAERRRRRGLTVATFPSNLGFARAVNEGVGLARGEYVAILNSDTIVTDNWADLLIAALHDNPSVGIVRRLVG